VIACERDKSTKVQLEQAFFSLASSLYSLFEVEDTQCHGRAFKINIRSREIHVIANGPLEKHGFGVHVNALPVVSVLQLVLLIAAIVVVRSNKIPPHELHSLLKSSLGHFRETRCPHRQAIHCV
jgi:hypothetical protein